MKKTKVVRFPSLKTSLPSLIGDLIPWINSIDAGVVLNILDLIALVPMSIDAIFIYSSSMYLLKTLYCS